jgi:hypothetical protein
MLCSCSLHRFASASAPPIEKQCHAEPGNWRALYNLDESVLGSMRTSKKARQRPHPAEPGATSTNSLAGTKSVEVGLSLTVGLPVGWRRRWGTHELVERRWDYRENREGRAVCGWANVTCSPLYNGKLCSLSMIAVLVDGKSVN